jgi:hypothetical protein
LRALSAEPVECGALLGKALLLRRKPRFGVTHCGTGSRCLGPCCGIAFGGHLRGAFLQRSRAFQPLRTADIFTAYGGGDAGEKAAF